MNKPTAMAVEMSQPAFHLLDILSYYFYNNAIFYCYSNEYDVPNGPVLHAPG